MARLLGKAVAGLTGAGVRQQLQRAEQVEDAAAKVGLPEEQTMLLAPTVF